MAEVASFWTNRDREKGLRLRELLGGGSMQREGKGIG